MDELLAIPDAIRGDDLDLLLEFRHLVRERQQAEAVLRLICALRLRLEQRYYLAFYRLRRWLESNLVAWIRSPPGAGPRSFPIRLDFYCPEAIRRATLCVAAADGLPLSSPHLEFAFRLAGVGPAGEAVPPEVPELVVRTARRRAHP